MDWTTNLPTRTKRILPLPKRQMTLSIVHRCPRLTLIPTHQYTSVGSRWSRLKRWYHCCPRPMRCVPPPISASHLLSWPHAAATGDNRVIGNVLANGVKYKMQGSAVTLTPSSGLIEVSQEQMIAVSNGFHCKKVCTEHTPSFICLCYKFHVSL